MPLTLAQLTAPLSGDQATQQILDALAGRGVVLRTGTGTGSCSVSGTPTNTYSVVLSIVAGGELATATYKVSTDGGVTYGGTSTTPSNGTITVGSTGATAQLAAGPSGGGTSFVAGDTFSFSLSAPNFPVTSWQSGGVVRNLVQAFGQGQASASALIAAIAKGGLLYQATGDWLTLLATNVYALTRSAASSSQVQVTLTDAAGAGPFTIVAGQLWVASTAGLRFNNLGGGTLPKSGTLVLTFQAESPGAVYNVGDNTITTMVTSLPGVTCNNPGPTSVTTTGADQETDAALRARCTARWSALGSGGTAAAYDLWARTAVASVNRTLIIAEVGLAGVVDVVIAAAAGVSSGADVTAVQNYINARAPLGIGVNVLAATTQAVPVTATVNYYTALTTSGACLAAITAALNALINSVPIVGTLYLSQVYEVIQLVTGVRDVSISLPAGNTNAGITQILIPGTYTLTLNGV